MRFIINLSIFLYLLLASSRAIFQPISYINNRLAIYHPSDDYQTCSTCGPRGGIEVWPTCETTSDSPSAADVLAIAHNNSRVIRVGDTDDTHVGKAWAVAGTSGVVVGVFITGYGVGVPPPFAARCSSDC